MKNVKIRVLVIDDSIFMRTLVSDMLNSDPEIEVVDTAKDGKEAIEKLSKIKPDCITLDLVMPGWDGLTTLEHIMAEYPTPVVILSAHSKKNADITIKCLNAGAVSFVLKPQGELSLNIKDIKCELLEKVKVASKVDVGRIKLLIHEKRKQPKRKLAALNKIIIIGASTGGPQALEAILYSLPVSLRLPVIIVQHFPTRFFTESLAEHLNKVTDLEVKVVENAEVLQPGKVYFVPAGFQMTFIISDTNVITSLTKAPANSLSPSIDIVMESAAKIYNGNSLGIILSGIGHDGREGMRAIKEAGGKTIAQDESSLIFGMPRAVIEAGIADKVLSVNGIADAMMECGVV